jgi:hypothetical protein
LPELARRCRSRTDDALAGQLDGVCMPELVRREPAADSGLERESAQLATHGRG